MTEREFCEWFLGHLVNSIRLHDSVPYEHGIIHGAYMGGCCLRVYVSEALRYLVEERHKGDTIVY